MDNNTKILIVALVVIFLVYFIVSMCGGKKRENFGSVYDGGLTMNLPGGIPYNGPRDKSPSLNTFANIVAPVVSPTAIATASKQYLPPKSGEMMDYRDMLPDVNTHSVSYDADVSDPNTFMWRPSVRASIHNRNHALSCPFRGDLAVVKDDHGGWFASRYSESDAKLDGYFSDYTNAKFSTLTGQRSYPQHIANEGLIMDGGSEQVLEY